MKLLSTKVVLLIAISAIVLFSASAYGYQATSKSNFCITCHVMTPEYNGWQQNYHKSPVAQCVDCHLPQQSGDKFYYKVKSGIRDVYKVHAGTPDLIQTTDETKEIIDNNCRRCHTNLNQEVHKTIKFKCFECHLDVYH